MTKIQLHEAAQTVEDRTRVTLTCISEMRGAYPDIALPGDIDRVALGEDAFFVTLPIGQAGAKSRNQRRYSRAAVEQMVAQINEQRPEGMWGHVAPDEAQTRYDPPAIRWLAAALDGDGIAWGKGLPLTAETREYYRLAKATNARVGTSLVAWAQMDGSEVTALELVAVDLADPARVGVPVTAAQAVISQEMEGTEQEKDSTQRRKDAKAQRENGEVGARHASPLQEPVLSMLQEMLGEGDVVARVKAVVAERETLRDAVITATVERAVRVPAAQAVVEELVRARLARQAEAPSREAITAAVAEVVERESVRALLRDSLAQAMGPAQHRAGASVRREG
ncbi:MAG: hypothetical protein U0521_21270, partial [Anaerolineae bacterium]